jgi:hypothetical protein
MYNGQERRIYKRKEKPYMARFRVKQYEDLEIFSSEWDMISLKKLGAGGAYFFYKKDLGIGTLLDLNIDAPKSMRTMNCVGEILRSDKLQSTSMFCIAIKFIGIGEQQEEEAIYTAVAEALEQAYKTSVA